MQHITPDVSSSGASGSADVCLFEKDFWIYLKIIFISIIPLMDISLSCYFRRDSFHSAVGVCYANSWHSGVFRDDRAILS